MEGTGFHGDTVAQSGHLVWVDGLAAFYRTPRLQQSEAICKHGSVKRLPRNLCEIREAVSIRKADIRGLVSLNQIHGNSPSAGCDHLYRDVSSSFLEDLFDTVGWERKELHLLVDCGSCVLNVQPATTAQNPPEACELIVEVCWVELMYCKYDRDLIDKETFVDESKKAVMGQEAGTRTSASNSRIKKLLCLLESILVKVDSDVVKTCKF